MAQQGADDSYDIACIGGGPANLSLTALGQHATDCKIGIFDQRCAFDWHAQAMFDESYLQTSFLEDLVTPVMPTHPLSFVNYLYQRGRLPQFLNFNAQRITRAEFQDYLFWADSKLDYVHREAKVEDVEFDGNQFIVHHAKGKIRSNALSIGVGLTTFLPEWAEGKAGVYHAWDILSERPDMSGKRVIVVGGGQSSAEIVMTILNERFGRISELKWVCRRPNLIPIDRSPFVNEFYSPQFVAHFSKLPKGQRSIIDGSVWRNFDGVSPETVETIYGMIYDLKLTGGDAPKADVIVGHEVADIQLSGSQKLVFVKSTSSDRVTPVSADVIIFAGGFQRPFPPFMSRLKSRMDLDDEDFQLGPTYRAAWDGPKENAIYAMNRGRGSHGVVDSSLCMAAWRSATILNDYLGYNAIEILQARSPIDWDFGLGQTVCAKAGLTAANSPACSSKAAERRALGALS